MTDKPLKLTLEDIEKMLPEKLDFILLKDPHKHTKSGEPCVTWILQKEDPLKMLKLYCDQKIREIYDIKTQAKRQAKQGLGELFYDHKFNRIYKRTIEDYGGYPDLRGFRKAFSDRAETTSQDENISL